MTITQNPRYNMTTSLLSALDSKLDQNQSIGKYLLNRLHQLGVGHIFGIPGDYIIRFDKLIEQHPIKFINTTRENTAGFMADAYARMQGLGVACITYGVGINIANAVSQAYAENSPVVIISGAAGTDEMLHNERLHHMIFKGSCQENTQLEIFKHITVEQIILNDPFEAAYKIDHALYQCLSLQKPIYIELPRNRVDTLIQHSHSYSFPIPLSQAAVLQEALNEIEMLLNRSSRPILWLGHEIQRFDLQKHVLGFAEKFNIPIVASLLGKGVISENHPLYTGVYIGKMSKQETKEFVEKSDCAIILGLVMSDIDTGIFTAKLEHCSKIIASFNQVQINGHHYQNIYLRDFVSNLNSIKIEKPYKVEIPRYAQTLTKSFIPAPNKKITTSEVFNCLQSHLTSQNIVVADIGDCLFGASELILEQNSFLSCAYFATLGFGIPGAIGAQFASPEKRVLAIVGDGAFQMTGTELSTAVRYQLDPIILILNNHGYGTERPLIEGDYNDLLDWNYTEITRMLGGGIGIKVANEQELERALQTAFSRRGNFFLIEIELDKTDFSSTLRRFSELASKTT